MSELNPEAEAQIKELAREIAREEIASFSGLFLRRLQDAGVSRSGQFLSHEWLSSTFAEALNDFGKTEDEPGDA